MDAVKECACDCGRCTLSILTLKASSRYGARHYSLKLCSAAKLAVIDITRSLNDSAIDAPLSAINTYLAAVCGEAATRDYSFDKSKIGPVRKVKRMAVTSAQLEHEWRHLLAKLKTRHPALCNKWRALKAPQCHPLLYVRPASIAAWERLPYPWDRNQRSNYAAVGSMSSIRFPKGSWT